MWHRTYPPIGWHLGAATEYSGAEVAVQPVGPEAHVERKYSMVCIWERCVVEAWYG